MAIEGALGPPAVDHGVVDRWFYMFMAALFIVVAVAGFSRPSLPLIAAVAAGHASPPLIVHVHAASMTAWLLCCWRRRA